jgi:uncharacterized alpha-E superfamily protein
MLGKTAGGLFWMYRYLERVENTARMVDTGQRIAMTRASASDDEWASVLNAAAVHGGYSAKYDELTRERAIDWMLRDQDNPSSVLMLMKAARDNARLVRTALTHEVWEAVNGFWMELSETLARKLGDRELPRVLELVRARCALVRGATHATMMRNDMYNFAQLGTFMERADNTCRILDVKYYVLLPSTYSVGSALDNAQWDTILRSLSATGSFRLVHGQKVTPRNIVDFLVLDRRVPRSINYCARKIIDNLTYLERCYGFAVPSHDLARSTVDSYREFDVEQIFDYGLHEFIQAVLSTLATLSHQIEIDYRFVE